MEKRYIIGNWKSNKTVKEAKDWLTTFHQVTVNGTLDTDRNLVTIVCVPFVHISPLFDELKTLLSEKFNLLLGAQDVSPFPDGAYTGAVSAHMLSGLVSYCLIGHSERRTHFAESDEIIAQKAKQLLKYNIQPILCVQDANIPIPDGITLVAYEPVWAIGSGKPATPEHANEVASMIKSKKPQVEIIYGGSVTADNVGTFLSQPNIVGVLPGGASLDTDAFSQLLAHAKHQN